MSSNFPYNTDDVLRGLWGSIVNAAAGGRGAANMWAGLKEGAYNWAKNVLNVTSATPPTEEEIYAKSRELIGHVTIQDMNRYTQYAGQYLKDRASLRSLDPGSQITGDAIFVAPWAKTVGNRAIPTRYRIRVQRDITVRGFTHIQRTEWSTYELSGPIGSVQEALDQANRLWSENSYNSRASINSVLDYVVEAV